MVRTVSDNPEFKKRVVEEVPTTREIKGTMYTISDIFSMRFMEQKIGINRTDSIVNDGGPALDMEVAARIMVMSTKDGKYIIESRDEIYFPKGRQVVLDYPSYIYDAYCEAVSLYTRLGYEDIFSNENSSKNMELRNLVKDRKKLMNEWWQRRKLKGDLDVKR